jgi:hypothetical protein
MILFDEEIIFDEDVPSIFIMADNSFSCFFLLTVKSILYYLNHLYSLFLYRYIWLGFAIFHAFL